MLNIGCHLSISNGFYKAAQNAVSIGGLILSNFSLETLEEAKRRS